jgi:hypothetical protein
MSGSQVPTLFAENGEEALNALNSDLPKAHYDINKINKNFFMAEHVDSGAAEALVKKPR